jgi:hypothetical protein
MGIALFIRVVLSALLAIEIRTLGGVQECQVELVFDPNGGKTRARIEKIMEDFHLQRPLNVVGRRRTETCARYSSVDYRDDITASF